MTQAKFPMLLDEERAKYVAREIKYEQEAESLRQQLAEKDQTVLDNVEIQQALRQQLNACRQVKQAYIEELANMQKREVMLRQIVENVVEINPALPMGMIEAAQAALSATADLEGLVLCDSTVWFYNDDAGDTKPLYRAWEPK